MQTIFILILVHLCSLLVYCYFMFCVNPSVPYCCDARFTITSRVDIIKLAIFGKKDWTQGVWDRSVISSPRAERITRRWNNNSGFSFDAVDKVGPLVHVPHPWQARLRQTLDCTCRKNVWPYVDIGQRPLEALFGVEASSNWILFLSKHQRPSASYGVSFRKSSAVHMQCSIFVELPCTIAVSPRRTNVMPSAVISWFTYSPIW